MYLSCRLLPKSRLQRLYLGQVLLRHLCESVTPRELAGIADRPACNRFSLAEGCVVYLADLTGPPPCLLRAFVPGRRGGTISAALVPDFTSGLLTAFAHVVVHAASHSALPSTGSSLHSSLHLHGYSAICDCLSLNERFSLYFPAPINLRKAPRPSRHLPTSGSTS